MKKLLEDILSYFSNLFTLHEFACVSILLYLELSIIGFSYIAFEERKKKVEEHDFITKYFQNIWGIQNVGFEEIDIPQKKKKKQKNPTNYKKNKPPYLESLDMITNVHLRFF